MDTTELPSLLISGVGEIFDRVLVELIQKMKEMKMVRVVSL